MLAKKFRVPISVENWQQEIAKNRSAKNSTAKSSSLGISAGLGNREWKMEVLKIEVIFLAVQVGFLFLDSPWSKIGSKIWIWSYQQFEY